MADGTPNQTSTTLSLSITENSGISAADRTPNQTSQTRSCSVKETESGSSLFVIQGYSVAKGIGVGKHIASEEFTAGGLKWAIYFYPDGKTHEDDSIYVSVFIALESDRRDVPALFELTLMDQSGKGRHKVSSNFKKSCPSPFTLKCRGSMWGYERYCKRNLLERTDYLRNDCLKFYCTIGVVDYAIDRSRLHSIQVPDSNIGSQIVMLLDIMEGCDIIFNVSGEKLHAHKLILATRSPKFQSELLEGVDTEEVMVPDSEPKVFKALLHFIYRDALPENELIASSSSVPLVADTLAAKLLAAADHYELKRLKKICESHMCKNISVNSVTQVLALADRYNAAELKDVCLTFAAKNLEAVMRSDGFDYFEENYPSLKSELLNTVAGCVQDCGTNGRRVRQRVEELSSSNELT
ncbi:BTB-POZ and MATH domain 4 [Perilla frutescens var. frutescens]|nr:BTB-POZ and MATH domain 4 [Perilla frutescens var. frutescens]